MSQYSDEYWSNKLVGRILLTDEETTLDSEMTVRLDEIPEGNRILFPGDPMTEDYRSNRLNVFLDENRVIQRVFFG